MKQARDDISKSPLPFTNSVLSAYAGIEPLHQQLEVLELQKGALALRYGPNHPRMRDVDGKYRRDAQGARPGLPGGLLNEPS